MTKRALGRGLGTLIPGAGVPQEEEEIRESASEMEIARIVPNRFQPRQVFEDKALEELTASIRIHGVIQPILVRRLNNGVYELIAGERRWRAAQIAGLKKIPVVVKDIPDEKSLEFALIENLQRENLNPIEAAQGYQRLLKEFTLSQEEIATRVGKERSTITNYLRLLSLPEKIKDYLAKSLLTPGHAKAILAISDRDEQIRFAGHLVARGASVREAEAWSKEWGAKKRKKKVIERRDPTFKDVEERLQRVFGTKVRIFPEKKGGKVVLEYYTLEDLNRILEVVEG